MRPRGSRFRGLALHAAHEQARQERVAAERTGARYEFKGRRPARREQARGWAEEVLAVWLEGISAVGVDVERSGADLVCVASSDMGDVAVTMITPYRTGFEVRAICEPWLVRVEIGRRPSQPSAWVVDVGNAECVSVSAIGEEWRGVLATPRVRTGLLSFFNGGATGLFRHQVRAALDRAIDLATLSTERSQELLWLASQALAESFGRGRWARVKRGASSRHMKSEEARTVVDGLWSCGFFESVVASRGDASHWASAVVVEGLTRDVDKAPISYEGRIRGRSRGWGLVMDVDLFRFSQPDSACSHAQMIPSSWAVARLSIDERPSFEAFRLSELQGLLGACFWMGGDDLLAGGFTTRVEQLVKEALSGQHGPYR